MRVLTVLFSLLILGGITPVSLPAEMTSRVRSLADVETLQVIVEDLNPATQKIGMRKEQIQEIAEAYLVKQGIKMVRGERSAPIVYLRLSSVVGGETAHAPISFYLTVQIKQLAQLSRLRNAQPVALPHEDAPLLVTTWEEGTMAMVNRAELGFYVRQILTNLLGVLVQDYQVANGNAGA
jgi:hypothetical protein